MSRSSPSRAVVIAAILLHWGSGGNDAEGFTAKEQSSDRDVVGADTSAQAMSAGFDGIVCLGDSVGRPQLDPCAFTGMMQLARTEPIAEVRDWLRWVTTSTALERDVDCDGTQDLVLVGGREAEGGVIAVMAVVFDWRNETPRRTALIYDPGVEELYEPVLLADLDGNGIQDIVSQYVFGGDLVNYVYLVNPDTIVALSGWGGGLLTFREEAHCFELMRPRVRQVQGLQQPVITLAVAPGEGSPADACGFDLVDLRVVGHRLRPIEEQ